METMIVEITIPAINKSFDFQLPASAYVQETITEVVRILEQVEPGAAFDRHNPILCHIENGRILEPSDTLAGAGVYDGVSLMLL